jgi:hypothetical protein
MRLAHSLAVYTCGFTALTAAYPASAESNPAKVRLTEQSDKGAVLIRVPVQPAVYALQFSKNGSSGFLSRVYMMKVGAGTPGFTWIARTLGPGRYRLDSLWQQGQWSACLERGTIEFDVEPGRIHYLGTLNTDVILESIQRQAVDAGETLKWGSDYFLSHGKTAVPPLGDRDEAGIAAARVFAGQGMNGGARLVELARVRETAFGTSKAGKAIKVCG